MCICLCIYTYTHICMGHYAIQQNLHNTVNRRYSNLKKERKNVCWNPSRSLEGFWGGGVHREHATCLLARPCNKSFSAPNSDVPVCLASLHVRHRTLGSVTCLLTCGLLSARSNCLPWASCASVSSTAALSLGPTHTGPHLGHDVATHIPALCRRQKIMLSISQ